MTSSVGMNLAVNSDGIVSGLVVSTVYRIVGRIVLRRKSVASRRKRLARKTGSSLIVAVKYVSGQYGHREEQSRLVTTSK